MRSRPRSRDRRAVGMRWARYPHTALHDAQTPASISTSRMLRRVASELMASASLPNWNHAPFPSHLTPHGQDDRPEEDREPRCERDREQHRRPGVVAERSQHDGELHDERGKPRPQQDARTRPAGDGGDGLTDRRLRGSADADHPREHEQEAEDRCGPRAGREVLAPSFDEITQAVAVQTEPDRVSPSGDAHAQPAGSEALREGDVVDDRTANRLVAADGLVIAAVASSEWSSTTMTSSAGRVWAESAASSAGRRAASLRAGTITDTRRPET